MTVYLAGRVTARERLKPIRDAVRERGAECASSWLDLAKDYDDPQTVLLAPGEATRDLEEIEGSGLFLLDTLDENNTGGREFEAGYAFALGHEVWLIGPRRNIFHFLLPCFDGWREALDALKRTITDEVHNYADV